MGRYRRMQDGEPRVETTRGTFKVACCDCGLVHRYRYRIVGKTLIAIRAWRDARATAAVRRRPQVKQ